MIMVRFILVEMHIPFKMAPRMLTFLGEGKDVESHPFEGIKVKNWDPKRVDPNKFPSEKN